MATCTLNYGLKRVLTDAYLYDKKQMNTVNGFILQIFDYMASKKIVMEPSTDLVLDITLGNSGKDVCGYYFANREAKALFWLEPFDALRFCGEILAMPSLPQISERSSCLFSCGFVLNSFQNWS
jgi:hypothetical protein